MKYHKLRIAWSVGWGIACVLLIVFWVRSQWRVDNLYVRIGGSTYNLNSGLGKLAFVVLHRPHPKRWFFGSQPAAPIREMMAKEGFITPNLKLLRTPIESALFMRFWIPVLASALLTALPWIQFAKRFGLRTLLIGMTVVAAILGLVIWASK